MPYYDPIAEAIRVAQEAAARAAQIAKNPGVEPGGNWRGVEPSSTYNPYGVEPSSNFDPWLGSAHGEVELPRARTSATSYYPRVPIGGDFEGAAGGAVTGGAPNKWDYIASTLDPVNRAVTNIESAKDAALEAAKRAASEGGDAAKAALKFLAENGDVFAKIALALGIGYAAATLIFGALVMGGLVLVLKK